jgi:hypothetical protein
MRSSDRIAGADFLKWHNCLRSALAMRGVAPSTPRWLCPSAQPSKGQLFERGWRFLHEGGPLVVGKMPIGFVSYPTSLSLDLPLEAVLRAVCELMENEGFIATTHPAASIRS